MVFKILISYILTMLMIISTLGRQCDDIECSNIIDEVCGIAEVNDRSQIRLIYQNYCFMKKAECEEDTFIEVNQVENELCNLTKRRMITDEGRRVYDFSIVGAHQACNHTCPTYCTDTYEPACAQIWKKNMNSYNLRAMVNHCHIDLFSCAVGLNVTIQPLGKCYRNPMHLQFMKNVAAMKSLKLLDLGHTQDNSRRSNVATRDEIAEISIKNHLKEVVRRLFEKFRNRSVQDESS